MKCIFDEESILLSQSFATKLDAIECGGQLLLSRGCITPEYIPAMIQRDKEVSVYLGNGIAIPHGISGSQQYIRESGVVLLQVPEGVSFDGENLAYVVICIAGRGDDHLQIISNIANTVCEMENVEKIRTAKSKKEILDLLNL